VGTAQFGNYRYPVSELWNGTAWTSYPVPHGPTEVEDSLLGISCPRWNFCLAVGSVSNISAIIEQWNGAQWIELTGAATAPNPTLADVSCVNPTDCMAVGSTDAIDNDAAPLAEHWDGTGWANVSPAFRTSPSANDQLMSVSCPAAGMCMAVGSVDSGPGTPQSPLAYVYGPPGWTLVGTGLVTSGSLQQYFASVSCPTVSLCLAVGSANVGGITQPLVEGWLGSSFLLVLDAHGTPIAFPAPGALFGVSCPTQTSCTLVGWQVSGAADVPLVLTWAGTPSWPVAVTPSPPGTSIVNGISCSARGDCMSVGTSVTTSAQNFALYRTVSANGYWLAAGDGGIFSFGVLFYGSTGGIPLVQPIVAMAPSPDALGYWLVASDGGVFSFGDAYFYGSTGGTTLAQPIVGMAPTPDGAGYWLVASDGGVFAFGDASFYGSTGGTPLARPIVGMAATPDGGGYWLVASDGGVFAFGDASFYGSTGGLALTHPIVGMAPSPDGLGYWLVASDGGIFAFGDAAFHGSAGSLFLAHPIVGMAATLDGGGYWLVASDGGIFSYGDAAFYGSTGGLSLTRPIVGMAAG